MLVGTLGKALGSYGAYACCDRATARYLVNTARTLIFSTALPPPAVAAAQAALEIVREQPHRIEKLARNAAVLRGALAGAGLAAPGPSESHIVPIVVGSASDAVEACERALRNGVFAQAIRPPTVPDGTSRLRLAAMACHTTDELREARADVMARSMPGGEQATHAIGAGRAPADARRLSLRGVFVTGTDTGVGKSILAAAVCAGLAARGERVAAFKPAVTGLDDDPGDWPYDHELLAMAANAGQTPEDVAPYRFGPAASPHLAAELTGVEIQPPRLLAAAARAGAEADALVVEGVGGLLVPLTGDYLVRDLAAALGLPIVVAARPELGTINHTLLALEAARDAGLEVVQVVLTPWPTQPSELEASNRATIERIGGIPVAGLPLTRPASLAQAAGALPLAELIAPGGGVPQGASPLPSL